MAFAFFQKNIVYNKKLAAFLWFSLSLIAVILEYSRSTGNNFLIFKGVFEHTIQQKNLYLEYPAEYADVNLYGPVFSLVIAPFAILPVWMGVVLWVMFNATLLYIAIRNLPIADKWKNAILIFSSVEMMNSAEWMQSNDLRLSVVWISVYQPKQRSMGLVFYFTGHIYQIIRNRRLYFFSLQQKQGEIYFLGLLLVGCIFCGTHDPVEQSIYYSVLYRLV
jgi:hypothetical protein